MTSHIIIAASLDELATMLHALSSAMHNGKPPSNVDDVEREKTLRLAVASKLRELAELLDSQKP
jgi:hypothetical protein